MPMAPRFPESVIFIGADQGETSRLLLTRQQLLSTANYIISDDYVLVCQLRMLLELVFSDQHELSRDIVRDRIDVNVRIKIIDVHRARQPFLKCRKNSSIERHFINSYLVLCLENERSVGDADHQIRSFTLTPQHGFQAQNCPQ